jgi:hypothetical protein
VSTATITRRHLLALAAAALPRGSRAALPAGGASLNLPSGFAPIDTRGNPQVYGATLKPEPRANHAARFFVYAPVARPAWPGGFTALFESEWRTEFGALGIGDTVAHYRGRLPGGVAACYMGRFFERPGQGSMYAVLYLLDLGDRAQLVGASVAPGWDGVGYPAAVDDSALRALAQALFPMLDSIRAPAGRSGAGPLFTRDEIQGRWAYQSGSSGGSFVDAGTGAALGTAVRGASGQLVLGGDGRYEDGFSMYAFNPGAGSNIPPQSQGHAGRYDFSNDVIVMQPAAPNGLDNRRKVAGVGRQAGGGRVLILLNPEAREFKPVAWVPVWDGHAGVMRWYREAA